MRGFPHIELLVQTISFFRQKKPIIDSICLAFSYCMYKGSDISFLIHIATKRKLHFYYINKIALGTIT